METPKEQRPAGSSRTTCSRSLVSESKIEEIIACLWSLMWVILWVNHAPQWMLWAVGFKAASDHLCAVIFAIREIRRENIPITNGGSRTQQSQ